MQETGNVEKRRWSFIPAEKRKIMMKEYVLGDYILGIRSDIGPRILKLAPKDCPGKNLFGILPDFGMETEEGFWHIYGGHRLWTAPEANPRSYSPDDRPVKVEAKEEYVKIYGNTEIQNSIQKEIVIRISGRGSLEVTHRIKNTGRWTMELACWALTVMKKGGFAILPVKRGKSGLLPDRRIILWPYTDLSDSRLVMGKDAVFLQQDEKAVAPCKIGVSANPCWTAYWVDGMLFVKRFSRGEGIYPDYGCSVEAYTNRDMLELETLGTMKKLEPGQVAEHREVWSIKKVSLLSPSQKELEKKIPGLF